MTEKVTIALYRDLGATEKLDDRVRVIEEFLLLEFPVVGVIFTIQIDQFASFSGRASSRRSVTATF